MHLKTILTGWLRRSAALLLGTVIATSVAAATDTTTYFHNDVSGSPMLATDATGQVVWKETYRPYGEKLTNSPASANNKVGFAGKPYDGNTGLSYMGARYYDPVVGRFMGIDPKEVDPNDLHSFNRYAYANNNPYKFVDPDGRSPLLVFAPFVGWAAGGAAIAGGINASWQFANSGEVRWGGVGGVLDAAGDGAILGPMFAGTAARSTSSSVGMATGQGELKTINLSRGRFPESAGHIEEAIQSGKPSTLTIDRAGAASRRKEALQSTPKTPGMDRDEYPPAMFKEGGSGASVRPINSSDNRGAGACIGAQCRGLAEGSQVKIRVTE